MAVEVGTAMASRAQDQITIDGSRQQHFNLPASQLVAAGRIIQSPKLINAGIKVAREAAAATDKVMKSVDKAIHLSEVETMKAAAIPALQNLSTRYATRPTTHQPVAHRGDRG
jgi:hypothetical protein